jgi:hypothetical protein
MDGQVFPFLGPPPIRLQGAERIPDFSGLTFLRVQLNTIAMETLQREAIPEMWSVGIASMKSVAASAPLWFGGVPDQILDQLANASIFYNNSVEYYEDYSNLNNYNLSIHAA